MLVACINNDIEQLVCECVPCQIAQNKVRKVPLHPWPTTTNNWQRVHIDFCYVDGHTLLILVDSKTKWLDVYIMKSTMALATMEKLRCSFAIFGLPVELVSDNGPPFKSETFKMFCNANGISHITSPPYHPPSNGLAERGVQTVEKH